MPLNKGQLVFDESDLENSDQVGAHILGSADAKITSSTVGGDEALDVAVKEHIGMQVEDAASAGGESGMFMLGVRRDADTSPVDADGDFHPFVFDDSGFLKVAGKITVEAGDAEYLEDSAHVSGDAGIHTLGVRQDTLSSLTSTDGDYASFKVDSLGRMYTRANIEGLVADDAVDAGNPIKIGFRALSTLSTVSASGDRADAVSDMYRRQYVNDAPNIAWKVTTEDATATAVQVLAVPLPGRTRIVIQNKGTKKVFVGNDNAVTISSGFEVPANSTWELPFGENLPVWTISESGVQALRLVELA
jgi:hypothetical protein